MIFVYLISYVLVLFFIFCVLSVVSGQSEKGRGIMMNCIAAVILLLLLLSVLEVDLFSSSQIGVGLNLITDVREKGSIITLITKYPMVFAEDFVSLVILVVIVNGLNKMVSLSIPGIVGKIISCIIIVLISIFLCGFVGDLIQGNIILKWCVFAVELFITTGGAIIMPVKVIANITGWIPNHNVVDYLVNELPQTALGEAISSAVSTTVMIVVFMAIVETQYGTLEALGEQLNTLLMSVGGVIIMIMGLYFLFVSLRR